MKKALCMIALAAISFETVTAAIPVKTAASDTTVKTKKMKMKKKMKDTTKM